MITARTGIIGFDADDTLWQNEHLFQSSQAQFAALLAEHADPDHLQERLLAAERRNLGRYGFGIKGFVLSIIETAIEVTDARVPASVIAHLIAVGQDMLAHPVEVLPGAAQTLAALAGRARLVLITKGDLLDQERKLAQSGLGDHFDAVEIVSEKTAATYARVFAGQGGRAMMVGNSLRSDVIPALAAGAWGVHVPHPLTWAHEQAESPAPHPRFHTIPDLRALPDLWSELNAILP